VGAEQLTGIGFLFLIEEEKEKEEACSSIAAGLD
jgi:hypothetical protein